MVEESSDENEDTEEGQQQEQQQEGNSDDVPLAELLRQEGEASAEPAKDITEEEVPEEELERLDEAHRAEMK